MEGSRFDAWTRRGLGLATGGALAAALGLSAVDDAEAKRKRGKTHKKRCRTLHQLCRIDGTKPRCCKPMACGDETTSAELNACCRYILTVCESDNQCCTGLTCRKAVGLRGDRCCFPPGAAGCADVGECCASDGVTCHNSTCCRHVQATCDASDECCGDLACGNVPALGSGSHCCAGVGGACITKNDCCGGKFCASKERVCV